MAVTTLNSNDLIMLNSSKSFLNEYLAVINRTYYPTIFQRCVSWMPIANLVISCRASSQSLKSSAAIESILGNKEVAAPKPEVQESVSRLCKVIIRKSYCQSYQEISKRTEQESRVYFKKTLFKIAAIALVVLAGGSLLTGIGISIAVATLYKTIEVCSETSCMIKLFNRIGVNKDPNERISRVNFDVLNRRVKCIKNTLELMGS